MPSSVDTTSAILDPTPVSGLGPSVARVPSDATETTPLFASSNTEDDVETREHVAPDDREMATEKPVHYRGIEKRQFWWLFTGVLFGNLIGVFDSTVMASSHPVITSYFHASNSASWLSTVFYLTSTIFQPLYGRISDTVGRRPVYLFAIVTFLVTTAWCALAQSIGSLILARAFAGLGAGGVISVGFIITSDVVKIEYRGLYQSYLNAFYGIGHSLGAALGGLLCDRLGWRAAFGIQIPFILAHLVLVFFSTPSGLGPNLASAEGKSLVEAFRSFDIAGSACLLTSVACLILGINLGGNVFAWTHPVVITALALFAVSGSILILVEGRATRPVLPLGLLSTRPIANLMFSNFCSSIVIQTVTFYVPVFLQAVRQTTPTKSGLYLLSLVVGGTMSAVFAGFYITWTRRMMPTMVAGVLLVLGGIVATVFLSPTMPSWVILAVIPWASTGQASFFPSTMIAVLALSSQEDQAVVTTTLGLMRNLGSVMGVAISSWVFQNALVMTLHRTVTGEDREEVILKVRESIQAIARLDPFHRSQVIDGYGQALRVTFLGGVIFAVVVVVLVLPLRLPRLPKHS